MRGTPIDAGFATFRAALMRGYFWFVTTVLAAVLLADLLVLQVGAEPRLWVGVPALGVVWVAAFVFLRAPGPSPWRVATLAPLVVLAVGWYAFALTAFSTVPGGSSSVLLSLVKIAVVIVGSMAERWTTGPLGTILGALAAEGAVVAGVLLAGGEWSFDAPTAITAIGVAAAQVIVGAARSRGRFASTALSDADAADELDRERVLLESRSRALVHDTILNELAALATTTPGRLPERSVEQLRRSLLLVDSDAIDERREPAALTGGLLRIVERMRESGLAIDVSGEPADLDALDGEAAGALALAVEQCLVNVQRHAGVDSAELVVAREVDAVSIMVIDAGVGFDPELVPSGHLGIAESVRGRIEALGGSVRVWSRPGAGTSVMLLVPLADGLRDAAGSAAGGAA
jgi:signal transduction histidine kinase